MSRLFRYLLCLLLFVTGKQVAQAQGQFPITAATQIIPPYSVYLPDYAVPGSDKLRVILVQNDLTQPSYEVRLQMTVERNGVVIMRSSPSFRPKALVLSPGVPTIIGGTDLYDYLQTANLTFSNGFNANDYDRTKSLPEGAYRITFTAFDYRRPTVQVSNTGANIFFFQKNDPPLLNMPICGSRVEKRDPQFLTFNWSSRNTPSPLAGSATEYVFSLYEIKPKGSNPDYIVRSARPIYTTVTEANTIVYGPGEPALIDSMQYVWVVQARDKSGRDLFSNQGLSLSCTFNYLGNNPFVANNISKPKLYGKATGERTIHLSWPLAPANAPYQVEAYRIQYRAAKKDGIEYDWYTSEKERDTALDLNSLEPGRTYEARLQWKVTGVYGPMSDSVVITTNTARAFNCSDAGPAAPASNSEPLASAAVGNIIKNGYFDVILTEVSGANGKFTGKGRVITPGLGIGLALTFKDISINKDMMVTKGEMQAVTEGIDKFTSDAVKEQRGGDDVGHVKTGDIVPDIVTNLHIFSTQNIKVDTAAGTITLTEGDKSEVINYGDKGKTLPLVIEDADGNLYNVDKNGKVTPAGTRNNDLSGNPEALAALDTLRPDKGIVTFSATPGNKYAFDAWKDSYAGKPVLDSSYEKLADGKYRVSAKAIAPGEQEDVTATLTNAAADLDTARLLFVSGKGISYPFESNGNNTYIIKITGGPAGDAQELYAVYSEGDGKYISLGKLLVASYPLKQQKVVLIPVGANTAVPEDAIRQSLQQAYGQVAVQFTVTTDDSFRGNKDWDLDANNVLQDTKSAFLSNGFTGEEKAMQKAYSKDRSLDDDAVYLFLVNEAALSDGDLLGKMPRETQFGFIFVKDATNESIGHTVAHETGHGAYTLEHTFSAGIGLSKGSTNNLMDYGEGYALLKYQWDIVHDPGHVWGALEGDGESQEAIVTNIEQLDGFRNNDGSLTFLSLAGKPITLKGKLTSVSFVTSEDQWKDTKNFMPLGVLCSFELDGHTYNAIKTPGTKDFTGYREPATSKVYADSLSVKGEYKQPVIGMPCMKDGALVFKVFTTSYLEKNSWDAIVQKSNNGEGTEQDIFFLSNYLENEGKAKLIYAKMARLTEDQMKFLTKSTDTASNLCGMQALYAFRAAFLIEQNQGLKLCMQDAENDARAKIHEEYLYALRQAGTAPQDNTNVSPSSPIVPIAVDPETEQHQLMWEEFEKLHPSDPNYLKYLYEMLAIYQQGIDAKSADYSSLSDEIMWNIISFFEIPRFQGRTCLMRNLPLQLRIALLKRHKTWYPFASKESLMADLVETTPDADIQPLLDAMAANNFEFLWSLYEDINGDNSNRFVSALSLFIMKRIADEESLQTGTWPPPGTAIPPPTKTKTRFLYLYKGEVLENTADAQIKLKTNAVRGDNRITISDIISRDKNDEWGNSFYEHADTITPFQYVRIRFMNDFRFQLPDAGRHIMKGDEIVVPAIWVYWLLERQETVTNEAVVRVILDAAGLVATAFSGPGPLLAVESVMGTTDIIFTVASERIQSSDDEVMKQFAATWDEFYEDYAKVMITGMIVKAGADKIAAKFRIKTDYEKMTEGIDKLRGDPKALTNVTSRAEGLLERLRALSSRSFDAKNLFYSTVLHLYLELKIANYAYDLKKITLAVAQGNKLVARGLTKEMSIADITEQQARGSILLDNVRWYKPLEHGEVDEVIGSFKKVTYADDEAKQVTGDLEMVLTKDGQVYMRVFKFLEKPALDISLLAQEFKISEELAGKLAINPNFVELYNNKAPLIKQLRKDIPYDGKISLYKDPTVFNSYKEALLTRIAAKPELITRMNKSLTDAQAIVAQGLTKKKIDAAFDQIKLLSADFGRVLEGAGFDRSFFAQGLFNDAVFGDRTMLSNAGWQKLDDARTEFGYSERQNGMVAEFNTSNLGPRKRVAHSGKDGSKNGTSPLPTRDPETGTGKMGQFEYYENDRLFDSESKFLEEMWIAIKNGEYKGIKEIRLYSDRPLCPSCSKAVYRFAMEFDIKFTIFEGRFKPVK